jgi:hypothetical protein
MLSSVKNYVAQKFNEWWDLILRWSPQNGLGCRLQASSAGIIVTADVPDSWQHPWYTTARWNPDSEVWEAFVKPGFVNGFDVLIRGTPLTAQVPLGIPLAWRNVLSPAGVSTSIAGDILFQPGEGYPKFFESLGVKPTHPGGKNLELEVNEERTKELRACDIFLKLPRIASRQEVSFEDLSTARAFTVRTEFDNSFVISTQSHYTLESTPKWFAPVNPTPLERLLGNAVEPSTDEIKIATVWAVSPEGALEFDEVDQTWSIYVQYSVWWNLLHASRSLIPDDPDPPLVLTTGLAAGVGDAAIASLLSPTNQANSQIDAYLRSADLSGRFWT